MVAALVHINEIATNSCGPSRVNHSHFWGRGEPALFWAKQAGNPEYCLAKLGSYTHAHLGSTFLHGRRTYLPVVVHEAATGFIHLHSRTHKTIVWEIWVQGSGIVFGLLELGG